MTNSKAPATELDAIVIGAGFGGIYQLYTLRERLGLNARAFDKAAGVGGTWYWNRYPGAMSDTESFVYRYSFDKDLLQDWEWDTRYLNQPAILAYLDAVVDRYGLREHIQLNTEVTELEWDEATGTWTAIAGGERFRARYVVSALGLLSATNIPAIPGLDTFTGTVAHTGAWPEGLRLDGKRVGLIGTGSTGTQVVCAASKVAAHLTVFQRSAQYSVPSGNGPVTPEEVRAVKARYDQIWEQVRSSVVAFGFEESTVPAMSVPEEERERVFQRAWDHGNGFYFMFGTFSDIATDQAANDAAADFIRRKIREIVSDPETARKLTPTDLYAKRPLCNWDYYEAFNRDNVELVSIKENPITEVTPEGVVTADGVLHKIDVLVLATGFDAVDGNYLRMSIRGRNGQTIKQHWHDGPTSYLGITTAGFPNLFMILGPNGPFTNLPPSIETQVDFITELIRTARARGAGTVEPSAAAEDGWTATCREIAGYTLFPKAESWIFGANIPGKPNTVMFYMAGLGAYRGVLQDVAGRDYTGFQLR